MNETDALIRKAVTGDEDAMTRLLERHGPKVEQTLSIGREWRSVLDPADVMQVTYLEAYLQISRFDPDRSEPFQAWLGRIAENNLHDAIRGLQRQKRPQPSVRIEPPPNGDSSSELFALLEGVWKAGSWPVSRMQKTGKIGPTAPFPHTLLGVATTTPSRFAQREERTSRLTAMLEALPEDYGRAVRLYDLESVPIAEVSRQMGRSGGAVHMLRARAHDRLREMLGSESAWFSSSA